MSLSPGTRFGPYEISRLIGAGGMGEVYRARDTRLKRDVALKVLPDAFAVDPARMVRFQREAEVLASLNRTNIAQIYGIEERALVMELVEGETLAAHLAAAGKSGLPLRHTLQIARQIADALEAAHEKGIVHRDLKPTNIMIAPQGVVKVLDFGLAAVAETPEVRASDETVTRHGTMAGAILGTPAYMSPEQAAGKPSDKRTDIWAFGVVLWEMITARRLFSGETSSHVLAAVLTQTPDWKHLPADTPDAIRTLLRRCLEPDPNRRLRDIADARLEIDDVLAGNRETSALAREPNRATRSTWAWVVVVVGAMAATAAGARFLWRDAPVDRPVTRLLIEPPAKGDFGSGLAVSPDGRRIAYLTRLGGRSQIFARALDETAPQPLPGTEGAESVIWSADGHSLAFAAAGRWKRLDIAGGLPQVITDMTEWSANKGAPSSSNGSGSWNRDGVILIPSGEIYRVQATGGPVSPVTALDASLGEIVHVFPEFLPDGRHFLYVAAGQRHEDGTLWVGSLDSKARTRVASVDTNVSFVPRRPGADAGHLIYGRNSTLMALPFDAAKLRVLGPAFPIIEGVDYANAAPGTLYRSQFSAAASGDVLAYSAPRNRNSELVWFDRTGRVLGRVGPAAIFNNVSLAPDGKRIAVDPLDTSANVTTLAPTDVWTVDSERGTFSRVTFERATNWFPCFSADGARLAFTSNRSGRPQLYVKSSSGSGSDDRLVNDSTGDDWCGSWSPDNQSLAYYHRSEKGDFDIWILPFDRTSGVSTNRPRRLLQTPFNESQPRFSPDGRWMAYTSDESGTQQVYVQPYSPGSAPSAKWQISTAPAADPRWSRDGKELYYLGADSRMMAVDVHASGGELKASVPKVLFETRTRGIQIFSSYAVSPDGRFLVRTPTEQTTVVPLTVVVNWMSGLK